MSPVSSDGRRKVRIPVWSLARRAVVVGTAFSFLLLFAVSAQDAVPIEILTRTWFIKVGDQAGSGFLFDYQGTVYLVTARHVVAGLPAIGATVQVWQSGEWKNFPTIRTLFPPSEDVDIAVFETNEKVPQPYQIGAGDRGVTMGQQVWFLGYPFGLSSQFPSSNISFTSKIPFIKRGTMSAIDSTNPEAVVLYVDAFNNPGFSGGPILYWSFSDHKYELLGVVQGYRSDTAKVLINGAQVDTNILVNSGILVGYSIKHVTQAIERSRK